MGIAEAEIRREGQEGTRFEEERAGAPRSHAQAGEDGVEDGEGPGFVAGGMDGDGDASPLVGEVDIDGDALEGARAGRPGEDRGPVLCDGAFEDGIAAGTEDGIGGGGDGRDPCGEIRTEGGKAIDRLDLASGVVGSARAGGKEEGWEEERKTGATGGHGVYIDGVGRWDLTFGLRVVYFPSPGPPSGGVLTLREGPHGDPDQGKKR